MDTRFWLIPPIVLFLLIARARICRWLSARRARRHALHYLMVTEMIIPIPMGPVAQMNEPPQEEKREESVKPKWERQFDEIMSRGLEKWKEQEHE